MLFHIPKLPSEMQITHLNAKLEGQQRKLAETLMGWSEKRELNKRLERQEKQRKKDNQKIYVLDFKGDMQASSVEHLREEITIILSIAKAGRDRVILRLESPGGLVHGYGLASAQLARLREAGFNLTICVDKVAASGGYMMACIAQEIIAAPFAVVGSIGVVAQMPNFHKFLQQHNIDFDVYTAGEYKRTVTVFGENSDEDRAKFKEELQQTHVLFKHFIEKYRPQLDVSGVATGEHWYGEDALKLNLVDKLETSDAYLLSLLPKHDVYVLHSRKKPTLGEKLGLQAAQLSAELAPVLTNVLRESMFKINSKVVMLKDNRFN